MRRAMVTVCVAITTLAVLPLCLAAPAAAAAPMLTLEQALRTALERNRVYRMAEADARVAANNVSLGAAGLLPKADLTGAYNENFNDTRQERVTAGATTVEEVDGAKSTAATAGVGASWTIFEGFSSLAALARLRTLEEVSRLRQEQARQDLAAQVIVGYGDAARQRRTLAALDSAVDLSRERVKITEGKYRLGSASKLEMLQARLDLNSDLSAQLRQRVTLGTAKRTLNRVMARADTADFEVADSIALGSLPGLPALKQAALEGNPAFLLAAQGKRLAAIGFREYAGQLFPKLGVSLGYNYGLSESEVGIVRRNEALGWTYGVNLRFNIFDGFAVNRDYRNLRIISDRAGLLYEEAKARVEADMAEAHAAYQAGLEVIGLERDNLQLARENVAISMERLRLGTIASLELRVAQENFVAAETRLVTARFEGKRAETELLRLAARLVPR